MLLTEPNAFSWMVAQTVPRPRRRLSPTRPGPIERLVLDALRFEGPLSCPQLAARLGLMDPVHYEMVRNAVYRLLAKRLIRRHAVGDGSQRTRRVVWALQQSADCRPCGSPVKARNSSIPLALPH